MKYLFRGQGQESCGIVFARFCKLRRSYHLFFDLGIVFLRTFLDHQSAVRCDFLFHLLLLRVNRHVAACVAITIFTGGSWLVRSGTVVVVVVEVIVIIILNAFWTCSGNWR